MNNIVENITQNLLSKLPEDKNYFTPNELLEYGIPDFIVKRINVDIHDNLLNQISMPETDWADMEMEVIRHAWNTFLDELNENRRLPQSYTTSIFENAVDDILSILVEPRKNIPGIIFDDETILSADLIENKSRKIVVYSHFEQALKRYLHKRDLKELRRERCESIITQIDQKLTDKYTPFTWLQLLTPWFTLMGDRIDSDLLRRFFEEKGKMNWADYFDAEDDKIDGNRILKILSMDEKLDSVTISPDVEEKEDKGQNVENRPRTSEERNLNGNQQSKVESDNTETAKAGKSSAGSDTTEMADSEKKTAPEKKQNPKQQNRDGKEEVPIWKRFIDKDDNNGEALMGNFSGDKDTGGKNDVSGNKGDKEGDSQKSKTLAEVLAERSKNDNDENNNTDEKPIIDLYKNSEGNSENFKELYNSIKDQKDFFVNHLFGGEENAFIHAIEDIAKYSNWNEASRYISKEIFRRNMIDIYSEVAIDFTDRLQTYFIEKNNSDINE